MEITPTLIHWYEANKRDLPWRFTHNPYNIWLSEIILQQTRVDQGMDYYYRFTKRFANIFDLARAGEEEVLKLWQGLGYYSRARNLHQTAKTIANTFNGVFPDSYEGLLQLKGIGPYTAAAIASISFGKAHPVLDGNVARVISRLFAITEPVNQTSGKNKIENILSSLIDITNPGTFNQAMMEFGALHCTPKNPRCVSCPLASICDAHAKGLIGSLPFKSKRVKVKKRFFNYFFIKLQKSGQHHIYLHKRTGKDIWQGLYDFPMIESTDSFSVDKLIQTKDWDSLFERNNPHIVSVSQNFKHQLTHRQIIARFYEMEITSELKGTDDKYIVVHEENIHKYPLPRLIDRYLEGKSELKYLK
jgi:A/G-specific adenine glycosylase